jgi:hypothetical protein
VVAWQLFCMPQSHKISIHAFEPVLWFGFYSMSALCNLKGARISFWGQQH